MSFWGELRRRNVVKVAIAYAIVGWVLVQIADTFFPALQLPAWTVTLVASLVILGLPIALIGSWAFELTPKGLVRTPGPSVIESTAAGPTTALDHVDGAPETPAVAPPSFPENSVAVLPLDNLSPDPDNAYFAAGLHEEILNQLAKLSRLHVISRTSVLRYANDRPPIAEIAKELNVQSIMEGSIRYAGNRIRATVQLIDSVTGAHLWSETYERDFDDIFAIESDIAINVAKALEAAFSREEQQAIEKIPTRSTEAYNLYLRMRPIRYSHLGLALDLCDQALELDPEFALVHMTKGYLYANSIVANIGQATVDEEERRSRFEELARRHADCALELDPSLDTAHLAHALIHLYGWHWSRARAAFDRISMNTLADQGTQFFIWLCAYQGDLDKAIEIGRRGVELSPNDYMVRFGLATALAYAGQSAAALKAQHDAVALNPSAPILHHWLAYIHVSLGESAEALAELRLTEHLMGQNRDVVSLAEIAYTYSRIGRLADAERLSTEIERRAAEHDVGAGIRAMICLATGDHGGAAEWIETAIEEAGRHEIDQGFWPLMNLKMNATADPVLEEPRFVALRDRLRGD
jgi:adenylate cyclase